MESPTEAPHLELGALALAEPQPPPPPPPHWLNARCSPADADAPCGFAELPDDVLFRVFTALPADARARCARVCAPWREALVSGADAWRFWTRLDLSESSGVACDRSNAALAGAAALARGRLQELDVSNRGAPRDKQTRIRPSVLGDVLRGNPELREVAMERGDGEGNPDTDTLQQLLAAAPPTLQCLHADLLCDSTASSLPPLRGEPPFGPLRMRRLGIICTYDQPNEGIGGVTGARRFGAAVAHAWVRELCMCGFKHVKPAALEALADALLARTCRVEKLTLWSIAGLSPAYLPALARLLAGRDGAALTKVHIIVSMSLFKGASAADVETVCVALRRATLTDVGLRHVGLTEQSEAALQQAAAPQLLLSMSL